MHLYIALSLTLVNNQIFYCCQLDQIKTKTNKRLPKKMNIPDLENEHPFDNLHLDVVSYLTDDLFSGRSSKVSIIRRTLILLINSKTTRRPPTPQVTRPQAARRTVRGRPADRPAGQPAGAPADRPASCPQAPSGRKGGHKYRLITIHFSIPPHPPTPDHGINQKKKTESFSESRFRRS